jgi:hypothetical protein
MTHEEKLRKLFDELSFKIGRNTGVITFDNFKKAINQEKVEAYEQGKAQIINAVNQGLAA